MAVGLSQTAKIMLKYFSGLIDSPYCSVILYNIIKMENNAYFLKHAFTGVKLIYIYSNLLKYSPCPHPFI